MSVNNLDDKGAMLSIGGLSKATGVPVETLRTWERRYGFPDPVRIPSGHRRYVLVTVERLRLVTRALEMGHKPSAVVGAEPEVLRDLLEISQPPRQPNELRQPAALSDSSVDQIVAEWRQAIMRFDVSGLERSLRRQWSALGAVRFLRHLVAPFLADVGTRWHAGELSVRHEHFASERLRDFLAGQWRALSDSARGARVVCATLPGEQHALGLHMAAVALALANVRVVFLGTDVPLADIVAAAHDFAASGVIVSISLAAPPGSVKEQLATLRRNLDTAVPLVAGGKGLPGTVAGVLQIDDFETLQRWAEDL